MQAIRAGRADEVRWYLYRDFPVPPGLTAAQARLVARQNASLDLYEAAWRGDVKATRDLLRRGADPNARIELDDVATPLAWAAACNRVEVVKALLDGGANVNQRFSWAVGSGAWTENSTPIVFAARYGSGDTTRLLIERGADVNAVSTAVGRDGAAVETRPLDWAETPGVSKILREAGARRS
jgi:ankyrin repeat protein